MHTYPSQHVEIRQGGDEDAALDLPARRRDVIDRAPLSHNQRSFCIFDRAVANRAIFNVCQRIRLRGSLNVSALQQAWDAVVDRQESLRTQLIDEAGTAMQLVLPAAPSSIRIVDVRDQSKPLDELIAGESERPFDLGAAPLWRVSLYRIADDDYLLVWCIHHFAADESSCRILLHDLWAAYDQATAGEQPRLEPLQVRYTDFSVWQREHAARACRKPGAEQHKKHRSTTAAVLPHFKQRPKQRTGAGRVIRFNLPSGISGAVAECARDTGMTPEVVYLAAFQALLFRCTNQTDIGIGVPVSSRPGRAVDNVVGCFISMAIVDVDFEGEPSFRALLGRARDALGDVTKHSGLLPEHGGDEHFETALISTAFIYREEDWHGRTAAGLTWHAEPTSPVGARFDFSLEISQIPSGTVAGVEFSSDLYDEAAAKRFVGHYATLLEAACRNPDTQVCRLPLLSGDEWKQIVFDWNCTAGPYPSESLVQHGFEEQVRRAPNRIAIVAAGREFSYRDIDERANRLANYLSGEGVARGIFVGVCLKRSDEMVVAVLAVLKAGGAYAPLDANHPKDRLAFMLQEIKAPIVLTQSRLLDQLPEAGKGVHYLCLDRLDSQLAKQSAEAPRQMNSPDEPAYVIFTSGSTGQPKGVLLHHRPVVNVLDWVNRTFEVSPADRLLWVTSLCFDLSVYDIFGILGAGGSIRIADESELREPRSLLRILKTEPITIWDSAPAALAQLAHYFFARAADPNLPVTRLRLVMLSGDWIPVRLPDQVRARFPGARVVSLGGATEAAIWSNWYPIGDVDPAWTSIPYGKPIRNARYHILDAHLQPLPVGVPGELHIGGLVLAEGYLNRDNLTRERFIDDPLAATLGDSTSPQAPAGRCRPEMLQGWPAGRRLYKTGDLARYFPDGNIEFLGRIDTQVKIRGFRVEVEEIEAVLAQQQGVQDAVVMAHRGPSGHVSLVAYVVACAGQPLTPAAITSRLHKQLPDYMVPSQIVFLDALPITPNGKVNRTALKAPAVGAGRAGRECVPPAIDAERALVAIWEEVLGIRPIGVTDDFQELGGHSLLAALVMARVESQLGHRIPIEALLTAPTVRGLAGIITRKLELGGKVLVPLQTGGDHPPMFLIAGVGGHVFGFQAFARRLGPKFNVYGMCAVGIDGAEAPLDSVPKIAERYLKEIRAQCPEGPYVVGGYSVGGVIAFELAQQMQAAGLKVSRVVIYDLLAPGYPRQLPLRQRLRMHVHKFFSLDWAGKRKYVSRRLENFRLRALRFFGRYRVSPEDLPGIDMVPQQRIHAVLGGLLKAWLNYEPDKPFDGQIVVISSTMPNEWVGYAYDDPGRGWSRWSTRPVTLYELDAPHTEFFRNEHVDELVLQMREVLSAAKMENDCG